MTHASILALAAVLLLAAPAAAQTSPTDGITTPPPSGAELDGFFDDVWSGIKTGANAVADGASTAWSGIKTGANAVDSGIGSAIGDKAWNGIKDSGAIVGCSMIRDRSCTDDHIRHFGSEAQTDEAVAATAGGMGSNAQIESAEAVDAGEPGADATVAAQGGDAGDEATGAADSADAAAASSGEATGEDAAAGDAPAEGDSAGGGSGDVPQG